ncbi:MAG: iron-sulfur cluster assembly scaffold protein [Terriglobales bacterium]
MYSPQVLDHFEHPRNVGELDDATAVAEIGNPACGDVLRLSLKIEDGRITGIRYRAKGCVPAIACGSALTELVAGRTIHEARALRRIELVMKLGGLPQASLHASHLAIDALAAALGKVSTKKSE